MGGNLRFLFKGHTIKKGDVVRAVDPSSGAIKFYRVVGIWGSHMTARLIPEDEAGTDAKTISISAALADEIVNRT